VTCRDPATPHVLKTRATAVRLKAGACVLMHTITLCYSHHPSVAPVIKSESTLGISEVLVYGLPVSNGFVLPAVRTIVYPGLPILGPVCIRPPSLRSPVSNPEPPETGMCMPRMQRLDTTFRTTMAYCASAGRSLVLACAARGA
jgi:hypothetical protein